MSPEQLASKLREALEEQAREQLWGTAFYPEVEVLIASVIRQAVAADRARLDPHDAELLAWAKAVLAARGPRDTSKDEATAIMLDILAVATAEAPTAFTTRAHWQARLLGLIVAGYEAVERAEREACARLVDECTPESGRERDLAQSLAAAIRARGEE